MGALIQEGKRDGLFGFVYFFPGLGPESCS